MIFLEETLQERIKTLSYNNSPRSEPYEEASKASDCMNQRCSFYSINHSKKWARKLCAKILKTMKKL